MKVPPVTSISSLMQSIMQPKSATPARFCCKICDAKVSDLRQHLARVHDMTAQSYRELGADHSLLPVSYAARKAAYLQTSAAKLDRTV